MRLSSGVFVLLVAAGAGGCVFEPRPDDTRYYTLSPEAGPPAAARGTAPSLGLGPITWPPYLARRELATRLGPEQIGYSAVERWAAPLDEIFQRALAEDLRARVPAREVVLWPWSRSASPDLAVSVHVLRFESEAAGAAVFDARWTLQGSAGGPALASGETRFREAVSPSDAAAAVAALARGIGSLARDVAAAVPQLPAR